MSNARLTDKFPSSTTLWMILRKFEAGVAGNGSTRNLTARGVPSENAGDGRLYYQTPVIHVMGRELSSFTDLQKSLAQLGFNSGNILLRLSFRITQEPLEEAMLKIMDYFKFVEGVGAENADAAIPGHTSVVTDGTDEQTSPVDSTTTTDQAPPASTAAPEPVSQPGLPQVAPSTPSVDSRPVTVFRPPSSSTPQSAQAAYDEEDYIPTIEHAQAHQRRLNLSSRPTRLPTDAEIAAKEAEEREKLASIAEVEVKIRFPEQSQAVAKFGQKDTGKALYDFVRGCLDESIAGEKFTLSFFAGGVPGPLGGSKNQKTVIPESDSTYLIKDLGIKGRVLVNFSWDPSASAAARGSGSKLLKPELRSQAQEIKVPEVPAVVEEDEPGETRKPKPEGLGGAAASRGAAGADEGKAGTRKGGGGVPKWFKMPGKK